ncbi:hypothetical protein LCGC14_2708320 [marine sediment metagenome]|uniref:Uncharacterized protein n=1 Tax=marine sediment metagenome TaxID=412755 RepID=A0A0F9BMU1_9ZZZZ
MPTLNLSFNIPDAAVARLQELLAEMNAGRVDAGDAPWANVNDMAEDILKNRLRLLVNEAERAEVNQAKQALRGATPAQIDAIKAILNP